MSAEKQLRARLAEQFIAKLILRMHAWREVLERTWRHPYVPGYYLDKNTPPVLCMAVAGRGALLVSRRPALTSRGSSPLSRLRSSEPLGQDVAQRLGALLLNSDHAFARDMGIERNRSAL